ncbi:transglycosylase SLT domain-containing protein [Ruicaihuangia caeni]|uniref:Transglycosylase SLT domain-containing protein n=1 Tax=Ruicaihuangia caeni TaxID=3042517 RepID=A0AAW6T1M7_9MICO|nr:transglycosylase SLT domain-containing protein [Klugiella sp. YN-L-19]MDI2097730.1 transglycosylase SLT domain-containing protein [Klugiella sp. YN-L-19]
MGKHSDADIAGKTPRGRRQTLRNRLRSVVPVLASTAAFGFIALSAMPTTMTYAADGGEQTAGNQTLRAQTHVLDGEIVEAVARDDYKVVKLPPPPPKPAASAGVSSVYRGAPAAGTPDPGTAKAIAYDMVMARGWDQSQYDCLVALWNKESGWNVYAHNKSSGAYGIPQSLPGSKMATAGADWATNPATQITWGLGYISGRYGTPCGAWAKSQASGWY